MKLIIQIPCLNEADTLGIALNALPREVPGFNTVEWLIIDDGSTDGTAEVARKHGVDHVVRHIRNRGLAHAFMTGIDACLARGADVIVNTDADNQYNANDIPALTTPILAHKADMVIGARPISAIEHFSPTKKALQKLGSWVVRAVSGTEVADAPSGFRAISRYAAQRLMVFNNYTYTLETIIQAGQKNLQIVNVPVSVNEDLRPSRLFKSIPSYIRRSVLTMLRIFVIYRPARVFGVAAAVLFGIGFLIGLRFLLYWLAGDGEGHVQSLILAAMMMIMGFQTFITAFLADVIAANRRLMEEVRFTQRRLLLNEDARQPDLTSLPVSEPERTRNRGTQK
jgi:glycosyltransferase involved in cell wall biosynthesis